MLESLETAIVNANLISFDIFDTLIARKYGKPVDLFNHLGMALNDKEFCKKRISSEQKVRERNFSKGIHEVSFDEIYEELGSKYKDYKEKEIALELKACYANPEMKEVFDFCLAQKKRIVIASDMYLPKEVIENILSSNGYAGYEKLFLSSDTLRPKATGEMYDDLIAYSKTEPSKILHIGDNEYTDVSIASQKGLNTFRCVPLNDYDKIGDDFNYFEILSRYSDENPAVSLLQGLIIKHKNEVKKESYWKTYGYKYAGFIFWNYAKWLKEQLLDAGIKKVFFMLRDGYIEKRIFDFLYFDIFDIFDIFGSRTMFMLAGMEKYEDIKLNVTGLFRENVTYQGIWNRLYIDDEELLSLYKAEFPNMDSVVKSAADFDRIDTFFEKHESSLLDAGKKQRSLIVSYLKKINAVDGHVAIVDLGWKGSMLKGIQGVCHKEGVKTDILGLYFGTHEFNSKGLLAKAFCMNNGKSDAKNVSVLDPTSVCIPILELVFSAPHPSVLGIKETKNAFEPIYQSVSQREQERINVSKEILSGTMEFIRDFSEIEKEFPLEPYAEATLAPLEYFQHCMNKKDKVELSKIHYFPATGNDSMSFPIYPSVEAEKEISVSEQLKRLSDLDEKKLIGDWQSFGAKYLSKVASYIFQNAGQNASSDNVSDENVQKIYKDFRASIPSEYARKILDIIFTPIPENKLIVQEIWEGIEKQISEFSGICSMDDAKELLSNLENEISKYDEMLLWHAVCKSEIKGKTELVPISKHEKVTIGIINPWPGDMSAESEVLKRFDKSLSDLNMECVFLDDFGHILDKDTQKRTETIVNPNDLDFAFTTHYETNKTVNTFYYHPVWNPPEIPLNLGYYYDYVTNNYMMNDDFLIYDDGGMKNHLKTMLLNSPRNLDGASELVASFPECSMLEPRLDNPLMFYCGMNWEILSGGSRHSGLFRLLDDSGCTKFFGPKKVAAWGGIEPWAGYKSYQYSIPFDGFSILQEINKCGICLVLSSDIHRRAGAVTNRAYEACAAGAVIISDDNEYMMKHFKDAALFITYNRANPEDTYCQLMQKYRWICSHKEEALQLARNAQKIFREKFSLDRDVVAIVKNHANRFDAVKHALFAKDESKKVLVCHVLNTLDMMIAQSRLQRIFENIKGQYYRNIVLSIACDEKIADKILDFVQVKCQNVVVVPLKLFDSKGVRSMTEGQAIINVQKSVPHDLFVKTNSCEVWFYDHITTLVRSVDQDGVLISYAGSLAIGGDGYTRTQHFEAFSPLELFLFDKWYLNDIPGKIMVKKELEDMVPEFVFDNVDGFEHFLYMAYTKFKLNKKLEFTRRMTIARDERHLEKIGCVLSFDKQTRLIRDIVRFEFTEQFGTLSIQEGVWRAHDRLNEANSKISELKKELGIVWRIKRTVVYRGIRKVFRELKKIKNHILK